MEIKPWAVELYSAYLSRARLFIVSKTLYSSLAAVKQVFSVQVDAPWTRLKYDY